MTKLANILQDLDLHCLLCVKMHVLSSAELSVCFISYKFIILILDSCFLLSVLPILFLVKYCLPSLCRCYFSCNACKYFYTCLNTSFVVLQSPTHHLDNIFQIVYRSTLNKMLGIKTGWSNSSPT